MSLRLRYAGYPSTALGPPDPEEWAGPAGPQGPVGPQGPIGPQGAPGNPFPDAPTDGTIYGRGGSTPVWSGVLPLAGGTLSGALTVNGAFTTANIPVVNVLDHGAKGDGTTADAAVINSILSTYAGKAVILFPNTGSAFMVHGLAVPSNSHLIIHGTLQLMPSQTGYILVHAPSAQNIVIEGTGTLDGNKANQTAQASGGIGGDSGINIVVRDLTITNCFNWPINLTNTTHGRVENVTMTNSGNSCEFAVAGHDCWFIGCKVSGINDLALGMYGGIVNSGIVNCVVSSIQDGIFVLADSGQPAPCSNILIDGNISYNNTGTGIIATSLVAGAAHTAITIANNICYGNTPWGIYVDWTNQALVTGNQCYSNKYATGSDDPSAHGDLVLGSHLGYAKVTNNYLLNCQTGSTLGFGIYLHQPSYVQVSDNWFMDTQTTKSMAGAVGGATGQHCSISGNHYGAVIGAADQVSYDITSTQGVSIDAAAGLSIGNLVTEGYLGAEGNTTAALKQGAYLQWNRAGNGQTYLINQKGLGTGGFHVSEADGSGNLTDRLAIDQNGAVSVASIGVGGATGPSWTSGTAAPAATAPVGSLYSRVGGAVGATLYVSRGAGTWAAVAGV
jgi:hypothetical protein